MTKVTACYHEAQIFHIEQRNQLIAKAESILRTWTDHFDAIAVSGYSSAMTAPILCHLLGKELILVRKDSEVRTSFFHVEGKHNQRVIFFDDLIATGKTFARIQEKLRFLDSELVGYYLYMRNDIPPQDGIYSDIRKLINMNYTCDTAKVA